MCPLVRSVFLSSLLVFVPSVSAVAEVLELISGETLIGRITQIEGETIDIKVGFPRAEEITVWKNQVKPTSLYCVLSGQIDPESAKDRAELGQACLNLGLLGHAIAEFREVVSLDSSKQSKYESKIGEIKEQVAQSIYQEIQTALDGEQWSLAKVNSEVLVDFYPGTAAGKKAKATLKEITARKKSMMTRHARQEKTIRKSLAEAQRLEARADKLASTVKNEISRKTRDRRVKLQVARLLEVAHGKIKDIEPLPEAKNERYGNELAAAQTRIQKKLGQEYLELGASFVQIRALPNAEKYSVKACELDPEGHECARLQNLIIQARLTSGWTRGGR